MDEKHLHIKNMVCRRCIKTVLEILKSNNIPVEEITLGEIKLVHPISEKNRNKIAEMISKEGFELITDAQSATVSAIKDEIIKLIHYEDLSDMRENISQYLSKKLHKDYSSLSKLFSEAENLTIEKFVIYQKVEKIKELLIYDEMNINEIALKMGYSSTAHLSSQFKRVTGFNPTRFKTLKQHKRKCLDDI